MKNRLWRAETALFFVFWVALLTVGGTELFRDPGTFWHTAAGERMLATGRVLRVDPFGSPPGRPWVAMQWLAECVMAGLYRVAGFDTLLLATATLLAALYAWLVHRQLRAGLHPMVAALVLMLVLGASSHHFHVRPHLATLVLLAWTFACLLDLDAGTADERRRRIWLLPPLYVVWTNVHGGVLGGLVTLGLVLGGWAVGRIARVGDGRATPRDIGLLAAVTALASASILVNPYGVAMVRTWLALSSSDVLRRSIQEHAPLRFETPNDMAIWAFGAFYILLVATVRLRDLRATWLVPVVWFLMATRGVRHAPLFALAAGLALPEVMARSRIVQSLVARNPRSLFAPRPADAIPAPWPWWSAAPVPVLAVAVVCGLQLAGVHAGPFGAGWARADASVAPMALLPALQAAARELPDGTPMFNEMEYGGFVIFHAPKLRVFIDDRCELYGDSGISAYVDAADRHPEALDAWTRDHDFRLALTTAGSPFDRYIAASPAWKRLATAPTAHLYARSSL